MALDWLRAVPVAVRDGLETWRYERKVMHTIRHAPPLRPARHAQARVRFVTDERQPEQEAEAR